MTPRPKSMTAGNMPAVSPAGASVSAGYAMALVDFALSRGADRAILLASSAIAIEDLSEVDNRIPFARYVALMRNAKHQCGDPALALEFGAATDLRHFSIVGLVAHTAVDMEEALVQLNRYGRLVVEFDGLNTGPRFEIVHERGERWMIDRRANANDFVELTESTWSRLICWTRREFPQSTFALAVEVTHAEPTYRSAYDRLWQVPITFGAGRNAIKTSTDWGSLPIQPASRYGFGVLTDHGDALLAELEAAKSIRGRIEALLLPLLHTGDASIEVIARKLQTSRQTLYRNLKCEGVTFAQVLDQLRHRMALHYLSSKRVSVNQTAYLVGFSEPAAFSRAFKRWTGRSPRTELR